MKKVILCADDYGQNQAISQAIVSLLAKKHLTATSCLVTSPEFGNSAASLKPLLREADIGLHFNLTEGSPLSSRFKAFYSLSQLIFYTHCNQLKQDDIAREFHAQLDKFEEAFNQTPHYIDGHQHIHQFPIIRDAIFKVYEQRLAAQQTYIRCTYNPYSILNIKTPAYIKKLIINLSGAYVFKKEVKRRCIPHNHSFSGIYDFSHAENYSKLFLKFITEIKNDGIIMCHPGLIAAGQDPIYHSRPYEYAFFDAANFIDLLKQNDVELVRFKNLFVNT